MMTIIVPAQFGDDMVDLAWISSTAVTDDLCDKGLGASLYPVFPK